MAHLETFKDGHLWVDKESWDELMAEHLTLRQRCEALEANRRCPSCVHTVFVVCAPDDPMMQAVETPQGTFPVKCEYCDLKRRCEAVEQALDDPGCSMAARIDLGHGINGDCAIRKAKCPPLCLLKQIKAREANENTLKLVEIPQLTHRCEALEASNTILVEQNAFAHQQYQAACELVEQRAGERDAALERCEALEGALKDVIELADEAFPYVQEYLRKKWHMQEDLDKVKAVLAALSSTPPAAKEE